MLPKLPPTMIPLHSSAWGWVDKTSFRLYCRWTNEAMLFLHIQWRAWEPVRDESCRSDSRYLDRMQTPRLHHRPRRRVAFPPCQGCGAHLFGLILLTTLAECGLATNFWGFYHEKLWHEGIGSSSRKMARGNAVLYASSHPFMTSFPDGINSPHFSILLEAFIEAATEGRKCLSGITAWLKAESGRALRPAWVEIFATLVTASSQQTAGIHHQLATAAKSADAGPASMSFRLSSVSSSLAPSRDMSSGFANFPQGSLAINTFFFFSVQPMSTDSRKEREREWTVYFFFFNGINPAYYWQCLLARQQLHEALRYRSGLYVLPAGYRPWRYRKDKQRWWWYGIVSSAQINIGE